MKAGRLGRRSFIRMEVDGEFNIFSIYFFLGYLFDDARAVCLILLLTLWLPGSIVSTEYTLSSSSYPSYSYYYSSF